MKKLFATIAAVVVTVCVFAQAPQKMSYQAVIRNTSNALVANQAVGMRVSILQGSPTGTEVYKETYSPNPQTNANGLVTIQIGSGTPVTGNFSSINWSAGPYFIKTETDPAGGTNYTITGTSQLLSVPYAMYSIKAQTADYNSLTNLPNLSSYLTTESDPVFGASSAQGISNSNITNWNTAYGWGNHAGLYRLITYVPAWTDVIGKPNFATVATSGNYNDLINLPTLFDGTWASLTGKPTTLSGYGITDAMNISHPAYGITGTSIANWNAAFGWGNHAGLYRPISYIPSWTEITSKPTTISGYGITDAVSTTGNQTIGGDKTFSNKIIVPQQGIGTATPNASSALEISSTTQGFLPPRMTQIQRDALTPAVEGLIIYNTTTKKPNYFDGSVWRNYDGTSAQTIVAIGDSYYGGIVAYILQSGDPGYDANIQHGLVAAPSDQSTSMKWANTNAATGATGTAIGTGNTNTNTIVSVLGAGSYAAKLCYDLVLGGYSDWYLPSQDELYKLYLNKVAIGGFSSSFYWSSTEYYSDTMMALYLPFNTGSSNAIYKANTFYVRAIRSF